MSRDEIFRLIAKAAGYDPDGYIGIEELDRINDAVNIIDAKMEELEKRILDQILGLHGV